MVDVLSESSGAREKPHRARKARAVAGHGRTAIGARKTIGAGLVLLLCPAFALALTLHAGRETLNDAEVRRVEDGKVVIAYQGGIGAFELAEFPVPEQKLILGELRMSADAFAKKRQDDQARKEQERAAQRQAEREQERQRQAQAAAAAEQANRAQALQQQAQSASIQPATIRCPYCDGRGQVFMVEKMVYFPGIGYEYIEVLGAKNEAGKWKSCPSCKGTGRQPL